MKKRKLIYLLSASTFMLGLASCKNEDFMSKDITIELPEKSKDATKKYDLSDENSYMDLFTVSGAQAQKIQNEFSNMYTSIVKSVVYNFIVNDKVVEEVKGKFIYDFSNGGVYTYSYYHIVNENVDSYAKVETTFYYEENDTCIVNTNISLENFVFGGKKKANGDVKITTKDSLDKVDALNVIDYFFYNVFEGNSEVFANDDDSYMYCFTEAEEYTTAAIGKDGLLTYKQSDDKVSEIEKYSTKIKYQYVPYSILSTEYDNKDYKEYKERKIKITFENMAFSSLAFFSGADSIEALLKDNATFNSWFTITEA